MKIYKAHYEAKKVVSEYREKSLEGFDKKNEKWKKWNLDILIGLIKREEKSKSKLNS